MKRLMTVLAMTACVTAHAQQWKTLPQDVRIFGYRNVTTSKVKSNYNQFRSESSLGTQFKIDSAMINDMLGNVIVPGQDVNAAAYDKFLAGEYKVDAEAQFNVNGFGFGYGITNKVMVYAEAAYYTAQVKTNLKRLKNNTYSETGDILNNGSGGLTNNTLGNNIENLPDINERNIQSIITHQYKYQPLGDWYGSGFGDMETGIMANVLDRGVYGLMLYPGLVLPTGRQDDPDILQDVGFGDGQTDVFLEAASGYVFNDYLSFGTTLRYTYQSATEKTLRIPTSRESGVASDSGKFNVKYGDKINMMFNSTIAVNDWLAFTPVYRFLYQESSTYNSDYALANKYLAYNSDKMEHQVQLTTSLSSIQPFMKKKFLLPAQINMNLVQTVAGHNVPKVGRFELEFRMLF